MAEGPSSYIIGKWFDAAFNAAAFSVAQAYMQLHTAAPGPAGTTAVATDNTRKAVGMGSPSTAANVTTIANDVAVNWPGLTAAQDASHYTLWDALSGGNFLGSGIINAAAYGIGDTLSFAIGAITISIVAAS